MKVRKARYHGPLSFNTRSYSKNGFPGPTLFVNPGDKVKLTLQNDLEYPTQADISWTGYEYTLATAFGACEPYSQPNMTSLHLHGMLISPNKKGDSAMRMCGPQEAIEYEFTIPEAHPSGTFFYHPHGDGSHSLQTAGLMAGMVIVNDQSSSASSDDAYDGKMLTTRTGNRVTSAHAQHMDDTLSLLSEVDDVPLLIQFQAIEATFKNYDFLSRCSHSSMPVEQVVYDGVSGYDFMLVNGWYKPKATMLKGVFQRWRFVNGASHRYLGFSVPDSCEAYAIASDGVYYDTPRAQTFIALSLGARMDVLIKCSEDVRLESEEPDWYSKNQYDHIFGSDPGFYEHHFMTVNITDTSDFTAADMAKAKASDEIAARIKAGTFATDSGYFGMDLTEGTDAEWAERTPAGGYVATDNMDDAGAAFYNPTLGDGVNTPTEWYTMNHKTYSGRISRRMRLNQLQIWNVTHQPETHMGHKKNHNWHLHTHHFQVMYATDDRGNVYTTSPMLDWQSGDWRDTVSVPANGTVWVRFKPTLYDGLLLHHCHIYNHETAGMKEMMSVVDCSASTMADTKAAVCSSLDDDSTDQMGMQVMMNMGSEGASKPTEDNTWPWVQQDTKYQCEEYIDYICTDNAMKMDYSSTLDWTR
mmetsp:Transcript_91733/g.262270  ORF Transcript_91733/g.262270 Transcript_91733/m.262270 type:complete len:639 (-) Transcript_91733:195-2111(-)